MLLNCTNIEKCDEAIQHIDKFKRGIQRRINGKEIKHKDSLQKIMNEYNIYREKIIQKRKQLT